MRRRALVAAVAGWVTVVGATSAVAWVAIDRAGREVLTATSDARVDPGAVTTGAPRTPRPPRSQGAPTTDASTPSSSHSTTTSAPRTTTSSRTRSSTSPASTSTTSSGRPRTEPTSVAQRPPAVDRTVRVEGGQVGVRCIGPTASLRFAQPANGWAVQVEDDGPEHVKVTFRSSGEGHEIEVEAECSGGTPVFSTSDDERSESDSRADD